MQVEGDVNLFLLINYSVRHKMLGLERRGKGGGKLKISSEKLHSKCWDGLGMVRLKENN